MSTRLRASGLLAALVAVGLSMAFVSALLVGGDAQDIGPKNGEIWVMNASGTSHVRLTGNRLARRG